MNSSSSARPRRAWGARGAWLALAAGVAVLLTGVPNADAAAPTSVTVLRPVSAAGHAAPGYRVVADHRPAIDCYASSPSAVDAGIATCGSSADYTVSCWRAGLPHHVLCLTDVFTHTLHRIRLSGSFPHVSAPKNTRPQGLQLINGMQFLIRDGGAAARLSEHPSWIEDYLQRGTAQRTIYGPPHTAGIDRSHATWRVTIFRSAQGAGSRRGVSKVYLVGTRR